MNNRTIGRIGAVGFMLWGALHILGGLSLLISAQGAINEHLETVGTAANETQLPQLAEDTVVSGITAFHSFNLIWIGLLVLILAITLNWKNSVLGFRLNLALTGLADLGLLLFLVGPGYMNWTDGLPGPVLFVICGIFSYLGLHTTPNAQISAAT